MTRTFLQAAVSAALCVAASASVAATNAEKYVPGIWVDPDGCEHWVMDDGLEGFMTPHVRRDGTPVCREVNACGVVSTDQFFATNSARVSRAGHDRLRQFFKEANAFSYIIVGHTDSRAEASYNQTLSEKRAEAVAEVARRIGARISAVRGYGEMMPKASNATAEGMAQNRRVEILCIR